MKLFRSLPLLFVFASSSLLAADLARVTDLNGASHIKTGVERIPLNPDSVINAKELVEVPSGATLKVQYSNGALLVVEGPARFRLKEKKDGGSAPSVDLLQGKLKCDCTVGTVIVRTQVGVATQSPGTIGEFDYKPFFTSGVLMVHPTQGSVSVLSDELTALVPSGSTKLFGKIRDLTGTIYTQAGSPGTDVGVSSSKPDLSIMDRPAPTVLSPNGEGAFN